MAVWKYTTVAALRAQGFSTTEIPDANALTLIEEASELVNELTDQWFVPIRQVQQLDGNGGRALALEVPILDFIELKLSQSSDFFSQTVEDRRSVFEPFPVFGLVHELPRLTAAPQGLPSELVTTPGTRLIKAQGSKRFPLGTGNLLLTGFFGVHRETIKKFVTTTTADFANANTTISLTDATGFTPGKILVFVVDDEVVYSAIVLSRSGNTITVDAALDLDATILAGAEVRTYGKVPTKVERATLLLVGELSSPISSAEFTETQTQARIKKERTDNYSYELSDADQISGGGTLLGRVDLLLQDFVKPGFVGLV